MKAFPKDVTVQTMTKRHIGVENELEVKGVFEQIHQEISKRGLLQSVGYDGGGREFRTNPISIHTLKQVRGYKYVSEYYTALKENTRVLETGGTHIHISILNGDHKNLEVNAAAMATAFYLQFQKIAGRKTHWASRLQPTTMEAMQEYIEHRGDKWREDRTYSMKGSMLGPTYHQTLEFRGPKGSNDGAEILAWVEFLDNVVKACNRESIEGMTFKRLLRGKRIQAYVQSLDGWRELTKEDLNQKFDGSNLHARRSD